MMFRVVVATEGHGFAGGGKVHALEDLQRPTDPRHRRQIETFLAQWSGDQLRVTSGLGQYLGAIGCAAG
jgi:hypothetical protein